MVLLLTMVLTSAIYHWNILVRFYFLYWQNSSQWPYLFLRNWSWCLGQLDESNVVEAISSLSSNSGWLVWIWFILTMQKHSTNHGVLRTFCVSQWTWSLVLSFSNWQISICQSFRWLQLCSTSVKWSAPGYSFGPFIFYGMGSSALRMTPESTAVLVTHQIMIFYKRGLDKVYKWACNNNMSFNSLKFMHVSFSNRESEKNICFTPDFNIVEQSNNSTMQFLLHFLSFYDYEK